MNRKQLTILIVAGAIIAALGFYVTQNKSKSWEQSNQRLGRKVIDNFPMNDVERIAIRQPQGQLTLARKNDAWVVQERGEYPANFSTISDLLRKVWDLKVVQAPKVSPALLARLELVPPDKGTSAGTLVEFKDKSGKTLNSLLLGKKHMREGGGDSPFGGGGGWPDGRYLMVGADTKTVAVVSDPFSNVDGKPADWLDKESFFKVEKLKSIAVTAATNSWNLARESETNEWKLAGVKTGEQLDTAKSSPVTSALAAPSFNDVATNAAPDATGLDKPLTARLETFDGFTYDVKVGKKLGDDKDDYYFQVAVDAKLVKERTPGKDEKPEDKAKLDKEFKDKVDKLEEKLKNEKALAKWTYVVSKYSIEPLLKERKDLLADKKEELKNAADGPRPTAPPVTSAPVKVSLPPATNTPPPLPTLNALSVTSAPVKIDLKPATNAPPPLPPAKAESKPAPAPQGK